MIFIWLRGIRCLNYVEFGIDSDFVVFDEVYEDLNMDKLKDMFTVKENNMPKTNSCNAKNFGELIYKKKIDSDFSKEMNRSIIENIKCFIDEK